MLQGSLKLRRGSTERLAMDRCTCNLQMYQYGSENLLGDDVVNAYACVKAAMKPSH